MVTRASPSLFEEAEKCRQKALAYVGQPEASFLLRVAEEFDRLVVDPPARAGEEGRRETAFSRP